MMTDQNPYASPQPTDSEGHAVVLPPDRHPAVTEELFEKVADCLIDSLGVDRDEIQWDTSIVRDLGGDPIHIPSIMPSWLKKLYGRAG